VANYLAPPLGNHLALEGFYPGGLFGRLHDDNVVFSVELGEPAVPESQENIIHIDA
jgi:hypothetical protein